jgi:hypothetical protein
VRPNGVDWVFSTSPSQPKVGATGSWAALGYACPSSANGSWRLQPHSGKTDLVENLKRGLTAWKRFK